MADTAKAISNIPSSAENVAKGFVKTEIGAAKALVNPNPVAKLEFIKDLAVGTYRGLKQRYGKGIGNAIESDPVGVLTGALSLGFGLRGAIRAGLRVPTEPEFTPAATKARAQLESNLQADSVTKSQIAQVAAARPGVAVPMDVGGENMLASIERLANTSQAAPEIRQFLTDRQQGQLSRITTDLKQLTGSSRTARQAVEQTMDARSKAAAPAYKAAYEAGDRPIWSPELERLSAVPEVQQAMHAAVSGWQRSQIAQGYGAMNPGATVERGGILKFLHGKVPVFPNLQFWDYTKGALSDMISNEIRPDGSMTRKGRDLTKIERSLRFQLDSAVPQYAEARNAWSGPSSYLNAVNHGRTILSAPSEDFIGDYNSLSNVDKQGAREAAVSTIIGRIGGNPAKLADLTRILRSPEMRAKVSAIMPNAAARAAWNQKLNFEVKSSEIATAGLGNSKTARRLALEQQGLDLTDDLVANEVRHAVSEGLVSKSTRYLILGWQKMRAAMRAEIDKEMLKGLTGKPMTKAIPKPRPIRQGVPAALPYALGGISSLNTNEGRGLGQ